MSNPWLYFAPRSNETSRENFLETLESGYPVEDVEEYLTEEEKKIFTGKKKLYIWGNQEGKSGSWRKMNIGDYVAFYAKGEFVYVGKCLLKKQSSNLAGHLWGNVKGKNTTWEYTFFLDEIRPISLPLSVIVDLGEYKEKMIVQGFMPINDMGMKNILNIYGSLTTLFDSYSSGIQTKDFVVLDELSKKDDYKGEDLEKLDKIFLEGNADIILKEFEQRLSNEKPELIAIKVTKIKRNQTIVRNMKEKFNSKCQICGFTFRKKDGGYYSEVAHINPIHTADAGVDKPSNLVVLCPNHHKMLDFGNIVILDKKTYKIEGETKDFFQPLY